MAAGWGCQFLTKFNGIDDWCKRLKHKCEPGCKGCIVAKAEFAQPEFLSFENEEPRKLKQRSDNPLSER